MIDEEVKLTVTEGIDDRWHVGLSRPDMVFCLGDPKNENDYRRSLGIEAATAEEAEQKVMLYLLEGKINTTTDRLWAWR